LQSGAKGRTLSSPPCLLKKRLLKKRLLKKILLKKLMTIDS